MRITTVPLSLEKLLEGQLGHMSHFYEVTAISSDCERLDSYGKMEGVPTFCVPLTRKITPWTDLKAVLILYKYFKRNRPSMVHTHTPKAGLVGMLAARMAGVPIRLHTVAGLPLMEATGMKRWLLTRAERMTYRCAHRIYPNSTGLVTYILKRKWALTEKVKLLGTGSSNGIDTNYFSANAFPTESGPTIRATLGISETDLVFCFVGRIVRDKGIHELVTAFDHIDQEKTPCTLLLVGPFEDDLDPLDHAIRIRMDAHEKIVMTGYQDDIRPYLLSSDIFTFPSYREGFPNTVMQAGAMGLPVIATDINGCNEIITDGVNGLLIPSKDHEALLQAMKYLMTDENIRSKMSGKARTMITTRYERSSFWTTLKQEYDGLLANL